MDEPKVNQKRRWPRRAIVGLLAAVVLLAALVALLPTLASTGPGTRFVVARVNTTIPGSVSIDGLTVGWFGGQRLEGVTLRDPEGAVVLSLDAARVPDAGLLGLLRGSRDLGEVTIDGLRADVVKGVDGRTNLERALAADADGDDGDASSAGATLAAELTLNDTEVSYREPGKERLRLVVPEATATLAGGDLDAAWSADAAVGGAVGTVSGEVRSAGGAWTGRVEVAGLPVSAIDTWADLGGYLPAVLGDAAGLTVAVDGWSPQTGGAVSFDAEAATGTGAALRLIDDGTTLRLAEDATVTLVQTAELSERLLKLANPVLLSAVVSASAPLRLTVPAEGFSLPSRGFAWSGVNASVRLELGDVTLNAAREPFAEIARALQGFNVLKEGALYEASVRPIELTINRGTFDYALQTFAIDDLTLGFRGTMSMTEGRLDVRLMPGGREIERNPVLRALVRDGVRIAGPLDGPEVELGSLTDALKKERVGEALIGVLGGLLEKELRKDERGDP